MRWRRRWPRKKVDIPIGQEACQSTPGGAVHMREVTGHQDAAIASHGDVLHRTKDPGLFVKVGIQRAIDERTRQPDPR